MYKIKVSVHFMDCTKNLINTKVRKLLMLALKGIPIKVLNIYNPFLMPEYKVRVYSTGDIQHYEKKFTKFVSFGIN